MPRQVAQIARVLPDIQDRLRADVDRAWVESRLAEWMRQNREELAGLLKSGLNWQSAASHFAQAGLTDVTGRKPNAETAEETWRRLSAR